jgi:hypothetical protein
MMFRYKKCIDVHLLEAVVSFSHIMWFCIKARLNLWLMRCLVVFLQSDFHSTSTNAYRKHYEYTMENPKTFSIM